MLGTPLSSMSQYLVICPAPLTCITRCTTPTSAKPAPQRTSTVRLLHLYVPEPCACTCPQAHYRAAVPLPAPHICTCTGTVHLYRCVPSLPDRYPVHISLCLSMLHACTCVLQEHELLAVQSSCPLPCDCTCLSCTCMYLNIVVSLNPSLMPFSDFIQTLETERGSTERSGNDRGVVERVGGRVMFIGNRHRK